MTKSTTVLPGQQGGIGKPMFGAKSTPVDKMKKTILLIGSQKGGVGKTTLAVSLAIWRKRLGRDVRIVDCDPQRNASKWGERRATIDGIDVRVPCGGAFGAAVHDEITELFSKYDDLIVDIPGHNSNELLSAMRVAHRFISPVQASQFDLDTMAEVDSLVDMMLATNPSMDAVWFLNKASTSPNIRSREIIDSREIMRDIKHLRPIDSYLSSRTCFSLVSRGLSVDETPASPSRDKGIAEFNRLAAELWSW